MTTTFRHQVVLNGGLGNQLFQIAALFAGGHNCQLEVDTSLGFDKHARFMGESLEQITFPTPLEKVSQRRLVFIKRRLSNYLLANSNTPSNKKSKLTKIFIKKVLSLILYAETRTKFIIITEADIEKFLFFPDHNYLLVGYFQSSRWFNETFTQQQFEGVKFNVEMEVQHFAEFLTKNDYKGLHFRMGDYVMTGDPYGVLPDEYYLSALSKLRLLTDRTILFSDSPIEASNRLEKNLKLKHELAPITKNAAETLYLMAHCKSLIIANSSLGWFAAQIGGLKGFTSEVVAPYPWFRLLKVENDLLPDNWRTVHPWNSKN